jgi:hypothetical protein
LGTDENLINERRNQFELTKQKLRSRGAEDVLTLDHCCLCAKKVWISFFHSLFSLFLAVFWIASTQPNRWHQFQSLASIRYSLIHSQPNHFNLRYVSLSFIFCSPISISAKKTILFAVLNVNRWWGCHCLLPWWTLECRYLCMIWCLLPWFFCQYHYQVHSAVILQITVHIVLCWICWCQVHSAVSSIWWD